jgi:hypothetical protein
MVTILSSVPGSASALLSLFYICCPRHPQRVNIALDYKRQSTFSIKNSKAVNTLEGEMFIDSNDFHHWAEERQLILYYYY